MKRILLLALGLSTIVACKDDPAPAPSGYPTDGLALPETKNALLINSYLPMVGYATDIPSLIAEDAFAGQINMLNVVNDANNPLYSRISDSLALNQPLQMAPAHYVNDETFSFDGLIGAIDNANKRRPIAAVNHAITSNDTAWIVDSKVKFFRDTVNQGFRIETYMLANVRAREYDNSSIDLKVNPSDGIVRTVGNASRWAFELQNFDSTRTLTTRDDFYVHRQIMARNFNPESAWGFPFTDYSPFGQAFSVGDIIGTRTTPIQHFFMKPGSGSTLAYEPGFDYIPSFLTVIWVLNEDTFKYEYINSVLTTVNN